MSSERNMDPLTGVRREAPQRALPLPPPAGVTSGDGVIHPLRRRDLGQLGGAYEGDEGRELLGGVVVTSAGQLGRKHVGSRGQWHGCSAFAAPQQPGVGVVGGRRAVTTGRGARAGWKCDDGRLAAGPEQRRRPVDVGLCLRSIAIGAAAAMPGVVASTLAATASTLATVTKVRVGRRMGQAPWLDVV